MKNNNFPIDLKNLTNEELLHIIKESTDELSSRGYKHSKDYITSTRISEALDKVLESYKIYFCKECGKMILDTKPNIL